MNIENKNIIRSLAGNLTDSQIVNLQENFELYLNRTLSLMVPIYRHCEYATDGCHSHPAYSFIYNIQQSGHIAVDGKPKENPFKNKASICAFSPGIVHQEVLEDNFSHYIAVLIESEYFENELKKYGQNEIILEANYFKPNENLLFLLKLLMLEHTRYKNSPESVINSLNHLITNLIIRIVTNKNNDSFSVNSINRVDLAIHYMHKHIDQKISVQDIASYTGLSASHFTKVFKDITQKTPVEYLTKIRLEKAKRMLKISNKNLSQIAFDCGFSSLSYFSRSFVDEIKMTPSEYREKFTAKANNEKSK